MYKVAALIVVAACGSAKPAGWPLPASWRSETIPFPLSFAPSLQHEGVEELRFPPQFLKPNSTNYWSYAFVWRLRDPARLDASALGAELTQYYRGLLVAVDAEKKQITSPDEIVATATLEPGGSFTLAAHVLDGFNQAQPIDLTGTARRISCGSGALWVFVVAPASNANRNELEQLAGKASCN